MAPLGVPRLWGPTVAYSVTNSFFVGWPIWMKVRTGMRLLFLFEIRGFVDNACRHAWRRLAACGRLERFPLEFNHEAAERIELRALVELAQLERCARDPLPNRQLFGNFGMYTAHSEIEKPEALARAGRRVAGADAFVDLAEPLCDRGEIARRYGLGRSHNICPADEISMPSSCVESPSA